MSERSSQEPEDEQDEQDEKDDEDSEDQGGAGSGTESDVDVAELDVDGKDDESLEAAAAAPVDAMAAEDAIGRSDSTSVVVAALLRDNDPIAAEAAMSDSPWTAVMDNLNSELMQKVRAEFVPMID